MLKGRPTRGQLKEQEIQEEHKCKIAVCAITEKLSGGQGTPIVGTGFLVRNLFPEYERKFHLVTTKEVISSNDLKGFYLCFKKSDLTDKEPTELARKVNPKDKVLFTSGYAIIPIDPSRCKPKSGLVNHRPFTVFAEGFQVESCELYCHVVEEDGTSHVVRTYKVGIEKGQYYLADCYSKFRTFTEFSGHHPTGRPHGAPVTTMVGKVAVAVGAITFRNDQISLLLFSQLSSALTCLGE